MQHWIEHPSEPQELLLAWQAPVAVQDRKRWAVGRLRKTPDGHSFRYLDDSEIQELNNGRSRKELEEYGYAGYPAFDVKKQPVDGFTVGVLEAFARRLPPPSRPDYRQYLQHFCYRGEKPLSTMAILALTEAKLPSDGFSLIDPLNPNESRIEVVFEVAGHRHNAGGRANLRVDQALTLVPDPTNEHDPNAVRIEADGILIGHVNRLQAPSIGRWLRDREVRAWLVRLNGSAQSPRAFAYVQVRNRDGTAAA